MAKLMVMLLACGLVACARPAPPPETPRDEPTTTSVTAHLPPADPCFEAIDLRDLLKRHAAAYGSEAQVEALLPRRVSAVVEMQGSVGTQVSVYDRERFVSTLRVGGFVFHTGLDRGPWQLGPSGVVQQLEGGDAIGMRYELWLTHRRYLSTIDPARDTVRCERAGHTARAIVSVSLQELGSPELTFEVPSAELVAASQLSVDGSRTVQTFKTWTAAQQGVRWPGAWMMMLNEPVIVRDASVETRIPCDERCLAMPADVFVPRWPKAGRVSVPMAQTRGLPTVKLRVGAHEAAATLDSSATLSFMTASSPFAAAFKPTQEAETSYAPERPVQIGVLEDVSLGELAMPRLPVVSVDKKRIEAATDRPELVLGASLFGAAAVRVDYKAARLVVATRAAALHAAGALAVPLHTWPGGRLVTELELDGKPHFLEIATGDAKGLTLEEDPLPPVVRGKLGNGALAGCAAVVFDVPGHTLWLEPPCSGVLSSMFAAPR